MKRAALIVGILACVCVVVYLVVEQTCKTTTFERQPKEIVAAQGVDVGIYDFEHFKPYLNRQDGRIHVINFWATWCVPCVAELPYFEKLKSNYPEIDLVLVSLDFPKQIKEKLIPFIIQNNLKGEVVLLDEPDGNSWIPQVDKEWSGAIPATVIYKNNQTKFYEQSFTYPQLKKEIEKFKQNR